MSLSTWIHVIWQKNDANVVPIRPKICLYIVVYESNKTSQECQISKVNTSISNHPSGISDSRRGILLSENKIKFCKQKILPSDHRSRCDDMSSCNKGARTYSQIRSVRFDIGIIAFVLNRWSIYNSTIQISRDLQWSTRK